MSGSKHVDGQAFGPSYLEIKWCIFEPLYSGYNEGWWSFAALQFSHLAEVKQYLGNQMM